MPTRYIVAVLLVAYASATISSCLADASHHGSCHGDIPLGDVASLVQKRHLNMNERRQEEHYPVQEKNGLVQEDEHESEAASGQRTNLGHGKKPGPSEVTLLGSDVNNERWSFVPALFDRSECDVKEWADDRVCEYGSYHEWRSWSGLREGRQNSDNRARLCADFCHDRQERTVHTTNDNEDKYRKSNTYYFSLGWSGDCRCCFQDGIAEWVKAGNWATWECVARPVACTMTAWSEWEPCSKSCGSGTRDRWRNVARQPKFGGEECGPTQESEDCKDSECPVDCELGEWMDWSACSVSCGEGERTRSRRVAVEEEHGGRKCEPDAKASEACKEPECPVDCELGEWMDWSACSVSCGEGGRTRVQSVAVMEEHGGRTCDPEEASEACKEQECPVDPPVDPLVEPLVEPQVCGLVKNAATTSPLDGVKVKIGELVTETDEKGKYCFKNPAPGTVEVTAEKEGWFDYKAKAAITNGMTSFDDIVLAQILASREWQIILEWKDKPKDLDAITTFGDLSGDCQVDRTHNVSEHCKNGMTAAVHDPNSDTEDQVDAESTTIKGVDPNKCGSGCMIYFRVQNYLADQTRTVRDDGKRFYKSLPLVDTKAIVRVLNETGEVKRFEAVNANSTHTDEYNGNGENGIIHDAHWYVFRIDAKSGEVKPCEKSQLECV